MCGRMHSCHYIVFILWSCVYGEHILHDRHGGNVPGSLLKTFFWFFVTDFFHTNIYLFAHDSILVPSINRYLSDSSPSLDSSSSMHDARWLERNRRNLAIQQVHKIYVSPACAFYLARRIQFAYVRIDKYLKQLPSRWLFRFAMGIDLI